MYKPILGLEVHIELNTKSKMFCSCRNNPNAGIPNSEICPICTGHPGTLPVINEEAVRKVIKTGLALNCQIPECSKFDRKNYFYPDLPKGYQISQYAMPLCQNGFLQIGAKKIRIRRVHLEEDTAKLIHQGEDSLIDFNRAGVPLMELVTEPDIKSGQEAREFCEELQLILRYLDVSRANMERGEMRCEVNISLKAESHKAVEVLGTKVEIKNLNSFKAVKEAIEYETERQADLLERGEKIVQETRGWDGAKKITVSQRSKEEAHDYRYFPEPDLPPLRFDKKYIQEIQATLPELPQFKRIRFKDEYDLKENDIETMVVDKDLGEYFEQVVSELREWIKTKRGVLEISGKEYKVLVGTAVNYLLSDLMGLLNGMSVENEKFLISPENFAEFVALLYQKEMTSKVAKMVLKEMFEKGRDPSDIIEEHGWVQLVDEDELEKVATEIIAQNQTAAQDFKKGKTNALQFLIGQAMTKTRGRANPEILKQIFTKVLK